MAYTKNPTWQDGKAGGTLITAATLNHLEDGVEAAAATADTAQAGLAGKAATSHTHAATDISDSTTTGRAVLTATDAAAARTAIGAPATSHTHPGTDVVSGAATSGYVLTADGAGGSSFAAPTGGGGGVSDHGLLTGLADDDHTQYHNDARGDARYYTKAQVDSSVNGKVAKAGDTMTGNLTLNDAKVTAGTTGATNGPALEVVRNGSIVGTISNDLGELKIKSNSSLVAYGNTNQGLRISGTTGVVDFGLTPTVAGTAVSLASHTHGVTDLTATGTKDATTFLRGDNTWAVPAGGGGGSTLPYTVTPGVGLPMGDYAGQSTLPLTAGRLYGNYFYVPRSVSVSSLVASVTTAGAAGSLARLGIYSANTSTLALSSVVDFGTVSVATVGTKTATLGTAATLAAGLYAVVVVADAAATLGCARVVGQGVSAWSLTSVSNNWRNNIAAQNVADHTAKVAGGLAATDSLTSWVTAETGPQVMPVLLDWVWV